MAPVLTSRAKSPRASRQALELLATEIVACRACPRLVEHREEVARTKRRAYAGETYWGRPVPGFGDPGASIVIVGLAPGAHGANRTGRAFTGDRSGEFLYAALHRAGLASSPISEDRDDELELSNVFITLPVRCAPPDNMPKPDEIARCASFFEREIAFLPKVRVFLALGALAWRAVGGLAREGWPEKWPAFEHGGHVQAGREHVLASYHVSQQNTQTGRLKPEAFDRVLRTAKRLASTP